MKLINYRFNFSILGCITEGEIECIGNQHNITEGEIVQDGFSSLLIQDWADISCPKPSPTGFWLGHRRVSPVRIGYPTPYPESFICATTGLHQSYHPHSFVKFCYMFCNVNLVFKGDDIIF